MHYHYDRASFTVSILRYPKILPLNEAYFLTRDDHYRRDARTSRFELFMLSP